MRIEPITTDRQNIRVSKKQSTSFKGKLSSNTVNMINKSIEDGKIRKSLLKKLQTWVKRMGKNTVVEVQSRCLPKNVQPDEQKKFLWLSIKNKSLNYERWQSAKYYDSLGKYADKDYLTKELPQIIKENNARKLDKPYQV